MLYNTPRTIEETFSEAANNTANGIDVKWHVILVSCGLIDMDKSTKNNTVCIEPESQYHYNVLKEKIEWLRPYYAIDPLITTVVKKMDYILKNPSESNIK